MNPAAAANQREEFKLKDTKPQLGERWPHGGMRGGGGWISSERATITYDLVEQMFYLYVRVVKAKDLPTNPEKIQSSILEVFVRDREMVGRDDYIGRMIFDINEVPRRVPPDSPLAQQWYRLEYRRGDSKVKGEVMLAVWMGTQADESFPEAWLADAASVQGRVFSVSDQRFMSLQNCGISE
ncbi:hypothetical protein CRYUN_Cryun09bG0067100 [Craigia yunnanensis]